MHTFTIHQAKTQLSKLIALAEAGEEVVIARGKQPVARITALAKPTKRVFGAFEGRYPALPDGFFFDPLPDEELKLWEGGGEPPPR